MATNKTQDQGRKTSAGNLYSFSRYAQAYRRDGEDEPYGVQIAGYLGDNKTARTYVNIWIGEDFKITRSRDGGYILKVKLVDVKENVKKGAKQGKEDDAMDFDEEDIPFGGSR